MKMLALILSLLLYNKGTTPLLVIDMNGKKPLRTAADFSAAQYMTRSFPIYAEDLQEVIEAVEKAARLIERKPACSHFDTVQANRTQVIVRTICGEEKSVSVRLITRLEEQKFLCDYELVRKEQDERTAQRKLLDFSNYLSQ